MEIEDDFDLLSKDYRHYLISKEIYDLWEYSDGEPMRKPLKKEASDQTKEHDLTSR